MKGTLRVKTPKLAGAGALAVGAATAATVFLLGTTAASAEPQVTAESTVLRIDGGVVSAGPSIRARAVDGKADHQELASIQAVPGLKDGGVTAKLLAAKAAGHSAEASIANLNVLGLVKADLVRTWCDGDRGGLQLVGASVLGTDLSVDQPNAKVDLSPILTVELNNQTRADGVLTVEGLVVTVLPANKKPTDPLSAEEKAAAGGLIPLLGGDVTKVPLLKTVKDLTDALHIGNGDLLRVTIGTATCTFGAASADQPAADDSADTPTADTPTDGTPTDGAAQTPAEDAAPAPVVVRHSLPVTG